MFDLDAVCANSFRNFHTKGLDYLCLSRTPELTRKVYFFEGKLKDLPEIVIPHDHRYNFTTTVLSGRVVNVKYQMMEEEDCAVPTRFDGGAAFKKYDRFLFDTPLNGGEGFKWAGEVWGRMMSTWLDFNGRGESWHSDASDIHTLDIQANQTVIMLEQGPDIVPVGVPTRAYRPAGLSNDLPNTSGLYDRMTPKRAEKRIGQFLDLVGNRRKYI